MFWACSSKLRVTLEIRFCCASSFLLWLLMSMSGSWLSAIGETLCSRAILSKAKRKKGRGRKNKEQQKKESEYMG